MQNIKYNYSSPWDWTDLWTCTKSNSSTSCKTQSTVGISYKFLLFLTKHVCAWLKMDHLLCKLLPRTALILLCLSFQASSYCYFWHEQLFFLISFQIVKPGGQYNEANFSKDLPIATDINSRLWNINMHVQYTCRVTLKLHLLHSCILLNSNFWESLHIF